MSEIVRRTTVVTAAWLLLGSACFLGLARATGNHESDESLYGQALRLTHVNACLRAEAELSKGERFYLVLDSEKQSLDLKLGGALLRRVPVDSIEVGRPHRLFAERGTRIQVRGRPHRRGQLTPRRPLARLHVEVPEDADEDSPTIMLPPEPENAIAVPGRFLIRYDDGLALEFRTRDRGGNLRQRIVDGFSTWFGGPELRILLVLDRAAAGAFYRSVPPETDLLVL